MNITVACRDFVFELARPEDESELRRLLRENPMPGGMGVSLEREPNFFLAASVEGETHQTVVARDPFTGRIVGMGSRSVREVFVNGQPVRVGYLSQLRVNKASRGRKQILVGGYAACRQLRGPGELPFDLTTIIESNIATRRLLEAGLSGLPHYRSLEPFVVLLLVAQGARRRQAQQPIEIVRGAMGYLPELVQCLLRNASRHQFAPVWRDSDFTDPDRVRGFSLEDVYLARRNGHIIGCMARWDQTAFKQTVVQGNSFPHAFVSHIAIDDDHPDVFTELLQQLLADAATEGHLYLALGLAARHPLLEIARRFPWLFEYRSFLYLVSWEKDLYPVRPLDTRISHLEVATL